MATSAAPCILATSAALIKKAVLGSDLFRYALLIFAADLVIFVEVAVLTEELLLVNAHRLVLEVLGVLGLFWVPSVRCRVASCSCACLNLLAR